MEIEEALETCPILTTYTTTTNKKTLPDKKPPVFQTITKLKENSYPRNLIRICRTLTASKLLVSAMGFAQQQHICKAAEYMLLIGICPNTIKINIRNC